MDTKTEKLYVNSVFVAMAVVFAGLILARLIPPPSPNASAAQIAALYRDHTNALRFGLILTMFGAACLGPWLAMLAKQVARIEGPNSPLTYWQLAFGALLVAAFILPLMTLEVALFRPDRPANEILLLSDLSWLPFIGAVYTFLVELLGIAYAIFRDKREQPIFPRWAAWFNLFIFITAIPGAFVVFHKTGPLAWNGLVSWWIAAALFSVWVVVMSILMLRAIDRPETEGTAGSPTLVPAQELERLAAEVAALRQELNAQPWSTPSSV